jgi:hypothetical protein
MLTLAEKATFVANCIGQFVNAWEVPAWLWNAMSYLVTIQIRMDAYCTR